MSVQEVKCLILVCDQCGTKASGFEDVYVQHFENREEMREILRRGPKT